MPTCPKCSNDDQSMIEHVGQYRINASVLPIYLCEICSKEFAGVVYEKKVSQVLPKKVSTAP